METRRRPARLEWLGELLDFIDAGATRAGFSEAFRSRVRLASEEALVNVIRHAYPGTAGPVEVNRTKAAGPALIVEIRDGGPAFDPLAVEAPDLDADLEKRRVGGLGVFFIRQVTDQVRYRRERGENVLELTFYEPEGARHG
jgi:serine/threonine-protein kinase RsbW